MNLSVGIVGLPNAGKSTLFNALLAKQVALVASYPFTTIEPNTGVVKVPDEKLEKLAEIFKEAEIVPSAIKFIDIAGLVKGAHKGEGLGNEFLSHIQQVDLILHLVGNFADQENSVDKVEIVNLELVLKDQQLVNSLLADKKLEEATSAKATAAKGKREILEKVKTGLGEGELIRDLTLDEKEKETLQEFNFLTSKPMFYVLNLKEEDLKEAARQIKNLKKQTGDGEVLAICAKLESDLTELEKEEQKEYLETLGTESGLDKVIKTAFHLLDLITFYTVKGGKIITAWEVERKNQILEAAAKVHTDFAKNFIKAEVIGVAELVKIGSWQKAREKGKLRIVGRDYQVKDGEVVEFKIGKNP